MTSSNDITGARLVTKPVTKEYEEGWDRIFTKPSKIEPYRGYEGVWVLGEPATQVVLNENNEENK